MIGRRRAQASRRIFTLGVLLLGAASAIARAADGPPNVLFILADDVGQEVLGCYGGESYETPRLDALARSGLRFEHGYAMAVCHPTRTTFLTGKYPFRLGNPGWGGFPEDVAGETVAQELRRGGYATAVAGKWQLALLGKDRRHPERLGFDEWCLFGWHEGPRYQDPMIWQNGEVRDDTEGRYGPDVYCEFLIDFMERHRDGPFFAWYSMALCHDVTDDIGEPVPYRAGMDRYESFAEMAAEMDAHVGVLIDALDRLELREETLVVFVGDNGTARRSYIRATAEGKLVKEPVVSLRSGREVPGGKGTLADTGTRVPLLVSWPGVVEAGGVTEQLVDMSDHFATLCDLAGVTPRAERIDGRSYLPRLRGNESRGRKWVFAEHGGKMWVRTAEWKLYADDRLFRVGEDPLEESPVAWATAEPAARRARARLSTAFRLLREPAAIAD